jgi:hypothetical protein
MRADAQLHDIRRARGDAHQGAPGGQHLRDWLDHYVEVGEDAGLAGLHHPHLLAFAADNHATEDFDLAGAALAGAAVMRHIDAAGQRGI